MRKFCGHIGYDDCSALDARRLQHNAYIMRIAGRYVVWNAIVADERRGKYKDLTTIRRVGH
jgi:hypothetical protein